MSADLPTQVWVLWWRYYDGSGFGVIRAYADIERANEDKVLMEHGDTSKAFELDPVRLMKSSRIGDVA